MLDEMQKKFEDDFTDEEKIQIFNLIFSGYYSLAYVRFLAQKKAGKDLGIEVKEPQNLLPPEGEGADYDDYLDAILAQPNKSEVVDHPDKPELQTDVEVPAIEVKETKEESPVENNIVVPVPEQPEVQPKEEVKIELPVEEKVEPQVQPVVSEEVPAPKEEPAAPEPENTIASSPISSSPLAGGDLSQFPSDSGATSSLEENNSTEETKKEEEQTNTETAPQTFKVVQFGVGSIGENAHEPTVEVIQEDSRPKQETASVEIKYETPDQVENGGAATVVLPQADSKNEDVAQPSQDVPTVSLEQLQNPNNPQS